MELEADGSWSWSFIFLDEAGQEMEESLRAQGTQNDVLCGAWPHPTECDFEGHHSKISAMGPEFLATALRAITVSGPSVYYLVFTPYSPFLTVTGLKSFSPHGGGRFTIDPLTNKSLFYRPSMMPAMTNVRSVFAIPEFFSQYL